MESSPQQEWLRDRAGTRNLVITSNDLEVQRVAAGGGAGIAGLPFFVGDRDPSLVRVPDEGPPLDRDVWVAVHRDMSRAPAVRIVVDLVHAWLREALEPSGSGRGVARKT